MKDGNVGVCRKCGFRFYESYGMQYMMSIVYEETVNKAKAGKLGEVIQRFFRENRDGAIDVEDVTLCCMECGSLENGYDLSMWISSNETNDSSVDYEYKSAEESSDNIGFVTPSDLLERYRKVMDYPHICKKCSGKMRIIRAEDQETLNCPICRKPLESEGRILWD